MICNSEIDKFYLKMIFVTVSLPVKGIWAMINAMLLCCTFCFYFLFFDFPLSFFSYQYCTHTCVRGEVSIWFPLVLVTRRLDDLDSTLSMSSDKSGMNRRGFNLGVPFAGSGRKNILKSLRFGMNIGSRGLLRFGESLRSAAAKAVIPKDLKVSDKKIFDPQDRSLLLWNRLFVLSCIISVSIDPVFFYLLFFEKDNHCVSMEPKLGSAFTTLRTAFDLFYLIHMIFQFHTAYIAPSSRVFGRGELVVDPAMIARRYLRHHFIVDFLSVLPVPQVWISINLNSLFC